MSQQISPRGRSSPDADPASGALKVGLGVLLGSLFIWRAAASRKVDGEAAARQAEIEEGHAPNEVNVGAVVKLGATLLVVLGLVLIGVSLLFDSYTGHGLLIEIPPPGLVQSANPELPRPPAPRLQAAPQVDIEQLRAAEESKLHSYQWVDQKAGIVRIPIERAIDLLLQQGLPARSTEAGDRYLDRGQELPSGSSSGRVNERVNP